MTRTDAFTLTALADSSFDIIGFFAQASDDGPAYGVAECSAVYQADGAGIHPGLFACDVCGAHYKTGVLFRHEDGKAFTAGETCANKLELGIPASQWRAIRKTARELGRKGIERVRRRGVARGIVRNLEPGVREALRAIRDHRIGKDLRRSLVRWSGLSERQTALALKIARDIADAANAPAPVTSPMFPDGKRCSIVGTILNAKYQESRYGGAYKMLVAVDGPEGRQKLWGACPQSLFDQAGIECEAGDGIPNGGTITTLPGRGVEFDAKIQHGSDADFAFYSRPTKARLIATA